VSHKPPNRSARCYNAPTGPFLRPEEDE
jgi:hypothetical protein